VIRHEQLSRVASVAPSITPIYYFLSYSMKKSLSQQRRSNRSDVGKPLVIAHRGASGLAPENTLAAFKLALSLGADGVEFDVQLSADGRPVVIHDTRVNRTTDSRGAVEDLNANQLGELDASRWFERRLALRPRTRRSVECALSFRPSNGRIFPGESVPTLESVLGLLAPAKLTRVYIELKTRPATRAALIEAVMAAVREFDSQNSVTVLSFDHEALKMIKRRSPEIRTAATFPVRGRALAAAPSIINLAREALADEVALHFGLATQRTVRLLHENGLQVSAWTANRPIILRRLIACGIDAIMTNYPNKLISIVEKSNGQQ
jgi:glycerophosphoryl diester phosphodiesterase